MVHMSNLDNSLLEQLRDSVNENGIIRWGQHLYDYPYGDDTFLTGWVDVEIEIEGEVFWVFTVIHDVMEFGGVGDCPESREEEFLEAESTLEHLMPWRVFNVGEGKKLWIDREDPTHLSIHHTHDVHLIETDAAVSYNPTWIVTELGEYPQKDARVLLDMAWGETEGEERAYRVSPAWSASGISDVLTFWIQTIAGFDDVVFVHDPDMGLPAHIEKIVEVSQEQRESEIVRRVIPHCGHTWLPEDAFNGEVPQRCLRPAQWLYKDPASKESVDLCNDHAVFYPGCEPAYRS